MMAAFGRLHIQWSYKSFLPERSCAKDVAPALRRGAIQHCFNAKALASIELQFQSVAPAVMNAERCAAAQMPSRIALKKPPCHCHFSGFVREAVHVELGVRVKGVSRGLSEFRYG